jgi:cytochrome c oxidase subunit I
MPLLVERSARQTSYLRAEGSWLFTHDHKRIGVMFLVATSVFLFLGGLFALLIRAQLLSPGGALTDLPTYNRWFTLHGVIMVFLFMIPALPSGVGNFIVPLQIGARDVAFPRLNLASFWVYVLGATLCVVGMVAGGSDTGWTFYVPYSTSTPMSLAPVVAGVFVVGLSSIMTGLNFIVTIHTLRARGVTWGRVPVFTWAIYATSIIQVLATPVLGMSLALVGLDYAFDWGLFDPARGGDPVLFQHLFWFYSHPAVYIMVLPALGVMGEVVSTFSHKSPLSYRALVLSSLGIAFVGFLTWGHHMFVAGMSKFDAGFFGALSMLVAVFSAIKVFNWVGTMSRGSIALKTPLFYFFAFLFIFVFGGMTGVALASTSLDIHWHDTYFLVAHFHFIMAGGVLISFLAALHYWFPKMFGRLFSERWGMLTAALVFMGFFLTFFPQFLLGNQGMPRRYGAYPEQFRMLHVLSSGGAFLLGGSLLLVLGNLAWALRWGRLAGPNPWNSACYEWTLADSPPVEHNFTAVPVVATDAYDYTRGEGAGGHA